MDEDTFQSLYKAVFNVLWNSILHRSFRTQQEAEGVALRAMAGKLGISHNQVSVRLQTAEGFIDGCLAALGVALEMDLCVQHEPVVMQLTGTRE
ncbi:putative phage antitermination protein Q [Yersinia wautersii]|uniref:Phage antitermination protein Q n=2 Tax=Yersinia wautersii TaxID=1341643 RepID=A0ABP1ZK74_9GAMM|nr:putative phage antitermination protein Q [Yersinia wautersii]